MGLFHHRQIEKSNCGGDQSAGNCGQGSCSPEDPRQQLADMRTRKVHGFADRSNSSMNGSVIIPSENSWSNDSYKATIAKNFQYTDLNYNQALTTAAREGKPIVAVFGSRNLRDSQHLVENAIPASARQRDAVYVYIDTDRAQGNPNFTNLINSEIKPTNLAHTRVYSLSRDGSGKLSADRPLMTAWGGRDEIGSLVKDHVTFGINNMREKRLAPDAVPENNPYPKKLPDSPPAPDLPPLTLTDTPPPLPVPPEKPLEATDNLFPDRRSSINETTKVLELPIAPAPDKRIPDVSLALPERLNRPDAERDLFPTHRSYVPRPFERVIPPPPPVADPATSELPRPLQHRERRAIPQQTEQQTEIDRQHPRERQRRPEDGRVIELNPKDFERLVRNSDKPVILDVSATWCGPCRNLAPILDGVAKQYSGQATVYKLDLDRLGRENPRLARELNASSIPAVFMYDRGKQVGRPMIGLESPASYHQRAQSLIERHAQSGPKDSQPPQVSRLETDSSDEHSRPATRLERRIERLKHKLEKLTHLSHEEKELAFKPSAKEQRVFQLINHERRKAGLPDVMHDPRLQIIANHHSNYQSTHNVMTHNENIRGWQNVSQRMKQVGLEGWRENAATGQFTPEVLVRMWMDSPPHRAAILGHGNIAAVSVRNGKATFNLTQDPESERG